MKPGKIAIVIGLALLASACADRSLIENIAAMKEQQPGFDALLHQQYLTLARAELDEGDHFDAGVFARRAEKAAKGETVEPDSLFERSFTDANRVLLHQQRGRLMVALDGGGRERFPELAATAQSQFDCWAQELEENYQPEDIRKCREGYEFAINKLEEGLKPKPMAKMQEPPKPAPAPAPAPQVARKFLVFFDFDSARLSSDAVTIIKAAVDASKQVPVTTIEATGHADRAGPARYNLVLSERRAEAVKAELMRLGVPASEIDVQWKGERDPLVPTGDGVREPQNRRVEIDLK